MAQKTRNQLKDLFKAGAKPSGDDFSDFVESTFNIQDDGLEKPIGADAPLKIISYGPEENLLDFYAGDSHSWRLNQMPSPETPGLNFANAAGSSKLFIASSSGNVGVSTTNPKARLHILQSGNEDALRIDDTKNDITPFLIDKEGKVGIGTPSPGEKLQVNGAVKATAFVGKGAALTNLSASNITTGTLDARRIPSLSATKITSGTLDARRIPSLSATKITSGALTASRIPNLSASKITSGTLNKSRIPSTLSSLTIKSSNILLLNIESSSISGTWLRLKNTSTGGRNWNMISAGSGNGEGAGSLMFNDQTRGAGSRMIIDKDGNVGIGTTSPSAKLHVDGSIKSPMWQVTQLFDREKGPLPIKKNLPAEEEPYLSLSQARDIGRNLV